MAGMFAAALVLAGVAPARAQESGEAASSRSAAIVSSEVALSRNAARLYLELEDGRELDLEIRDGAVWINRERAGSAPRGEELDRSWRELLTTAMEASTDRLPEILVNWDAPGGEAGRRLDRALEDALTGQAGPEGSGGAEADAEELWDSDTVARLNARIAELESRLAEAGAGHWPERMSRANDHFDARWWSRPFNRIFRGLGDILSTLALYAVLVGIGFGVVFFGRKYLEGVADTARHATIQSGLVGLAATFLLVPAFVLGTIALVISIVGIPLLVVWVPLFPVAVVAAAIFGYLAVAHAAGEALAERRFYGGEFFKRANSYYYVLTGLGLLIALYIMATVTRMAGPWLDFVSGLLMFLAVVVTWAAFTVGFGAILLSRAGTRPKVARPAEPDVDVDPVFEEESRV